MLVNTSASVVGAGCDEAREQAGVRHGPCNDYSRLIEGTCCLLTLLRQRHAIIRLQRDSAPDIQTLALKRLLLRTLSSG